MPIRLTRTIKNLVLISFVVFLIQQTADQFFGLGVLPWLALVPSMFWNSHAYWQIFTYSFVQRDVMQLFFNLMMLAFIGSELEAIWGAVRFLRYYSFCATVPAVFYLMTQALGIGGGDGGMPLVGASGAIYGLLTAYGIIFGERVLLFMMLFPMKAKHFVWVLGLIELMTTLFSTGGGASSVTLLVGMVAGFIYLSVQTTWRLAMKGGSKSPSLLSKIADRWPRRTRSRKNSHLKLIVNHGKDIDHTHDSADDETEGGTPKTWH